MTRVARTLAESAAALLLVLLQRASGHRQRYLLALSQMRSGSTLLHHLLQTSPEIIGAGETLRSLRSPMDLRRLALHAHASTGSILPWRRYVADQINHTAALPDAALLENADVSVVFLVREPRGAIGSTIQHLGRNYGWTLNHCIEYYCERTQSLCTLAEALGRTRPRHALALNYEALTSNTLSVLTAMHQHLGLTHALAPDYALHSYSGQRGDPSANIRAGTVLPANCHDELELTPAVEQQLRRHYERVLEALDRHCVALFAGLSAHG
jgi:hypothetical protein